MVLLSFGLLFAACGSGSDTADVAADGIDGEATPSAVTDGQANPQDSPQARADDQGAAPEAFTDEGSDDHGSDGPGGGAVSDALDDIADQSSEFAEVPT